MQDFETTTLQELKKQLQILYGNRLEGVYLFGSYARGTSTLDSDIDVLVTLKGDVKPGEEINRISSIVSDLCLHSNLLISIYPIPHTWLHTRQSPFFINVRKEAVAL